MHTKQTFLSDEEFLTHLYSKAEASDDDMESAMRLELLLNAYHGLLEDVHKSASAGLNADPRKALMAIKQLTGVQRKAGSIAATLQ
jgi:hypothetical protein